MDALHHLGKCGRMNTFVDDNLMHDTMTCIVMNGRIHLLQDNQSPTTVTLMKYDRDIQNTAFGFLIILRYEPPKSIT
jgi:hypothetical protein